MIKFLFGAELGVAWLDRLVDLGVLFLVGLVLFFVIWHFVIDQARFGQRDREELERIMGAYAEDPVPQYMAPGLTGAKPSIVSTHRTASRSPFARQRSKNLQP